MNRKFTPFLGLTYDCDRHGGGGLVAQILPLVWRGECDLCGAADDAPRHAQDGPKFAGHYYLSSYPPVAALVGPPIRAHWSVDNECHRTLEVSFGKDRCAKSGM